MILTHHMSPFPQIVIYFLWKCLILQVIKPLLTGLSILCRSFWIWKSEETFLHFALLVQTTESFALWHGYVPIKVGICTLPAMCCSNPKQEWIHSQHIFRRLTVYLVTYRRLRVSTKNTPVSAAILTQSVTSLTRHWLSGTRALRLTLSCGFRNSSLNHEGGGWITKFIPAFYIPRTSQWILELS